MRLTEQCLHPQPSIHACSLTPNEPTLEVAERLGECLALHRELVTISDRRRIASRDRVLMSPALHCAARAGNSEIRTSRLTVSVQPAHDDTFVTGSPSPLPSLQYGYYIRNTIRFQQFFFSIISDSAYPCHPQFAVKGHNPTNIDSVDGIFLHLTKDVSTPQRRNTAS